MGGDCSDVVRQQHSPFLRRPVQDRWVFRAAQIDILHTNKIEIGPATREAPEQAAHDVI
jgi:hypothetical protein